MLAVIVLLATARRDPRVRLRDDIADAVGSPVLAAVRSRPQRSVAGWSTLLETYEATPVESWAFRQVLRGLVPADRKGEPRAAGKVDHPQSLTVVSLSGDGRGLAIGPQLAAFASSLGIATRLVTAVGHDRAATLWAACAADRAGPTRPGLFVGDVPDGETVDLTIILVVVDRRQPDLGDTPTTAATILSVAAATATEQELARVAVAVDDAGRRIDGIVVADPDQTDRTSGRHTMDERSRRLALPTRLTGIGSSDGHHRRPPPEPHMIPARWESPDFEDDDPSAPGRPLPTLVSLHFLRSALRRRWVVCALSAVLGLLAAAAFLVAFPASHDAKATLVLAHDPQVDPLRAMSTDVSLLTSRTVAAKTIAGLGLTMTPDDFLNSVTVEPVSSDLVSLTLAGPTDTEAVRRLSVLTSTYLDFRAEQVSVQSNVLVDGMKQRIAELQGQVEDLTQQIDQLSADGDSGANDAISQRAQVTEQIVTLQQSAQEAALRSTTIVSSSGVIDPAAAETGGEKRRIVLTMLSGLIGGAALGCGAVLFVAITSDRLRRRFDVAAALEVPVPVSVGRIAPLPRPWLRFPHLRVLDARRADERRRLAHAIEMELPGPGQWGRLAVACVDNADEVRFAVATAATDLAARWAWRRTHRSHRARRP